jgi:starch phosphorylase
MDDFAAYQSVAHSIRDRLLERWNATQVYTQSQDPKRVYYLSLEFLLGRTLDNAMLSMGVKDEASFLSLIFSIEVLLRTSGLIWIS